MYPVIIDLRSIIPTKIHHVVVINYQTADLEFYAGGWLLAVGNAEL